MKGPLRTHSSGNWWKTKPADGDSGKLPWFDKKPVLALFVITSSLPDCRLAPQHLPTSGGVMLSVWPRAVRPAAGCLPVLQDPDTRHDYTSSPLLCVGSPASQQQRNSAELQTIWCTPRHLSLSSGHFDKPHCQVSSWKFNCDTPAGSIFCPFQQFACLTFQI